MNRNYFFKKLACVASIPAVVVAIATTTYQEPADALSTLTPTYETSYDLGTTTPTAPTAPAELISRYATYSFRLTNGRSKSIYYFYASPSNVDSWEEDILGSNTLSPDETGRVTIDDGRASCIYDFKAVFADGTSSTHYGIDVCDLSGYTF